jgi:hypothetical protein
MQVQFVANYAMNTFTLITAIGAVGVVMSFFHGARATSLGQGGYVEDLTSSAWRMAFYLAVFATILAAPLSA